jgi:hypothetical protein
MDYYPTSNTPIKTVGFTEFCEVNGRQFKRRKGTLQWTEVAEDDSFTQQPATPSSLPLYLSLVHIKQAPDEPLHWLLFLAREDEPGLVYQVLGDAECMTYQPSDGPIDIITESESFSTLYQLATLTEEEAMVVKEVAECEPPPRAPNRRAVVEICQGWSVRVIARLVERGLVGSAKLQMARSMMQPV